eukprot:COSAG02_NODE_33933_length_492_cov_0.773537_1_plen_155_part_01
MGFGKANGTSGNNFVAGDTSGSDLFLLGAVDAALGDPDSLRLRTPLPPVPPVPPVSSEEANEASEAESSVAAKCTARPALGLELAPLAALPPASASEDGADTGIDVPESRLSSSSEPSPLTDLLETPWPRAGLVPDPPPPSPPGADLTDIATERA